MSHYVSIPYTEALKEESAWDQPTPEEPHFRTVRFHLSFENDRALPGSVRMGGVLSAHKGKQELIHEIKAERETLDLQESVSRSLVSTELLDQISSQLEAHTGPISTNLKQAVSESLKSEVEQTETVRSVHTTTETITFGVTYQLDVDADDPRVIVAVYEQRAIDAYLEYIDFLDVIYSRPTRRLRKVRQKRPPHPSDPTFRKGRQSPDGGGDPRYPPNELRLSFPLGTYVYWKLLPHSTWMVKQKEYTCEVEDPFEVSRRSIENPRQHPRNLPRAPTLYQLSNFAFPPRLGDMKRGRWARGNTLKL